MWKYQVRELNHFLTLWHQRSKDRAFFEVPWRSLGKLSDVILAKCVLQRSSMRVTEKIVRCHSWKARSLTFRDASLWRLSIHYWSWNLQSTRSLTFRVLSLRKLLKLKTAQWRVTWIHWNILKYWFLSSLVIQTRFHLEAPPHRKQYWELAAATHNPNFCRCWKHYDEVWSNAWMQ